MIHDIYMLPWASVSEPIVIGDFVLLPWTNRYRRGRRLPDDQLVRRTVVRSVHAFKNHRGRPAIKSATILSRKSGDASPFSEEEMDHARVVVTIVAYAYFIHNFSVLARSSENLTLYQRRINTDPEHRRDLPVTSYVSGSIVRRTEIMLDTDPVSFPAPSYLNLPLAPTSPHKGTLEMLTKLYERFARTELAKRVWIALDTIFWAYSNVESLQERQRIVQLGTAFEALLTSKSDRTKARKIAEFVDRHVSPRRGKYRRKTMHGRPYSTDDRHTRYGWWVRELYDMRNSIVHGDRIDSLEMSYMVRREDGAEPISSFLLGLKFFDACLYEKLVLEGVMSGEFGERFGRMILRVGLLGGS